MIMSPPLGHVTNDYSLIFTSISPTTTLLNWMVDNVHSPYLRCKDGMTTTNQMTNKEFFLVRYFVSPRIQSDCGKIRTRKNSVFGHFSRSALSPLLEALWHTMMVDQHVLVLASRAQWHLRSLRIHSTFISLTTTKVTTTARSRDAWLCL